MVVEICKNIPTTTANTMSKFKKLTIESEDKPINNPTGVVIANKAISIHVNDFLIFEAINKVIKAMETGIW